MGGESSRDQSLKYSFFNEEEQKMLKSDYERGGVEQVARLIQNKLGDLDNTEFNIAVTGECGSGKSTFINTMRGLHSDEEGAAETGMVVTTMEPTPYRHPNFPSFYLWDLPGCGTNRFPMNKYPREMKFERYDFFLIISSIRVTVNDLKLVKEIKRLGKNFYFIRSKIDNDFRSLREGGRKFNEEELEKIRNYVVRNMQEAGIPSPRVFLISNFDLNQFDWKWLNDSLEDDLLNINKCVHILPNLNLKIVDKKREKLKIRVWMLASISEEVGAEAVPGVSLGCDIGILIGGIIHFRKCLGLEDASLQALANRAGKPVEDLKAVVNTPLLGEITPDLITKLQCSVAGSICGAGSSFLVTYKVLNDALDELTENARRVVKSILDLSTFFSEEELKQLKSN
ncbi:interferon-inducible GTPase 5-like [Scyliorhinus canicula]|uniref:interferon-inducible GTPase 5-like n=1 Tax=Scyliorhinus canicula TaxID=7830 RepID=UPI0018F309C8|nr:interferon-inducible GTPase 5-like [Scyliorhinus canicula]XP_038630145.1 interferon-inducible GTPase 5-like [Scyliorhinus canicula]